VLGVGVTDWVGVGVGVTVGQDNVNVQFAPTIGLSIVIYP